MPQPDQIRAKLYPTGSVDEEDAVEFIVDYVSFVNDGTYGPPPLIAPIGGNPPLAQKGDEVLYINTSKIGAFILERL